MEQPPHAHSSDIFIQSDHLPITYGQLWGLSDVLLDVFEDCGVSRNKISQIIVLLEESELSAAVIAALWLLDITFIPFSSRWSGNEIDQRLKEIQYDCIISSENLIQNIQTPTSPVCLAKPQWLDQSKPFPHDLMNYGKTDSVFAKIFTSGSTGKPKLVPLLCRQMISAVRASNKRIPFSPGECWLLCLPLSHIGGIAIILRALLCRASVFFSYPFESEQIFEQLKKYQNIQIISLVPTMLHRLVQGDKQNKLSSLKSVLVGGGPISIGLLRKTLLKKIPVHVSYGMTETCAQIASCKVLTSNLENDYGLSIFEPNMVEVRDENNNLLGIRIKGLIWLRGPQVFDGYEDKVKGIDHFDNEGWFCTEDYGWIDANGYIHITERADDVIITGGENVMPREVEQHLKKMPEILDASVIGVTDKEWGQRIVAYVIPSEDQNNSSKLSLEIIRNRLKPFLSSYKLPRELYVTKSLPKTSLGKTKKKLLKENYPNNG